jgi:hypothetical protein
MNNPDQDTLIRVVDGFWRVCCYCPGNLVLDAGEGLARLAGVAFSWAPKSQVRIGDQSQDCILISEGLARSYVWNATSCPKRRRWC